MQTGTFLPLSHLQIQLYQDLDSFTDFDPPDNSKLLICLVRFIPFQGTINHFNLNINTLALNKLISNKLVL